jgi:hypothetical protein
MKAHNFTRNDNWVQLCHICQERALKSLQTVVYYNDCSCDVDTLRARMQSDCACIATSFAVSVSQNC